MVRKAEIIPKSQNDDRRLSIGVRVFEDGRFPVEDLRPGEYSIRIAIHEPPPENQCGWGRLVGEYSRTFSVADGITASPLDLGPLEAAKVSGRLLAVGDQAPDFTIKTLDGKDLRLADFRGKFVLLDFWATWCAPCLTEMPNLQAVHAQFAKEHRLVLVALGLDEQPPGDVAYLAKSRKLPQLRKCRRS